MSSNLYQLTRIGGGFTHTTGQCVDGPGGLGRGLAWGRTAVMYAKWGRSRAHLLISPFTTLRWNVSSDTWWVNHRVSRCVSIYTTDPSLLRAFPPFRLSVSALCVCATLVRITFNNWHLAPVSPLFQHHTAGVLCPNYDHVPETGWRVGVKC
jgi:hypothetical protein